MANRLWPVAVLSALSWLVQCNKSNRAGDQAGADSSPKALVGTEASSSGRGGRGKSASGGPPHSGTLSASDLGGGRLGGIGGAGAGEGDGGQGEQPTIYPFQEAKGSSVRLGSYASTDLNKAGEPIEFSCPGDSVVTGINNAFDKPSSDRTWQASCQFFIDAQGGTLRKTSCTVQVVKDTLHQNTSFSCPAGTVLAGISSAFIADKKDREFAYQCCALSTKAKKPVVYRTTGCSNRVPLALRTRLTDFWLKQYGSNAANFLRVYNGGVNDEVNEWHDNLYFTCDLTVSYDEKKTAASAFTPIQGGVIQSLGSTYGAGYGDRRYSFTCCPLEVSS